MVEIGIFVLFFLSNPSEKKKRSRKIQHKKLTLICLAAR